MGSGFACNGDGGATVKRTLHAPTVRTCVRRVLLVIYNNNSKCAGCMSCLIDRLTPRIAGLHMYVPHSIHASEHATM